MPQKTLRFTLSLPFPLYLHPLNFPYRPKRFYSFISFDSPQNLTQMRKRTNIPCCIFRQLSAIQTGGKKATNQDWKQTMFYVEISFMLLDKLTSHSPTCSNKH